MKRVVVGLSGGVDSSVAAYLLKEQGFQVEGLFMKNWEEDDSDIHCPIQKDLQDAKEVSEKLQIPLHVVNFSAEYWDKVFEHFLSEYQAGRTPNPDILCNREIKFKAFLEYALNLGADFIATGHYTKNSFNSLLIRNNPLAHFSSEEPFQQVYQLYKGDDPNKDQSYFLYTLGQKALSKSLFPIGHLTKPQVRSIAKALGLPNFDKKDSTGICFIGERKFKEFLSRYLPAKPGDIETTEGEILGKHDGLMFYTLGQRQGLKIGGKKNYEASPWYVVAKDLDRNVLVVAQGEHPKLYSDTLIADELHWIAENPTLSSAYLKCSAKIRYRQIDAPCKIEFNGINRCLVSFENPQRAVTPGQSVVFYQDNLCLGGGIIQ